MLKEEKTNDNSSTTAKSKQLEVLKKYFPQCFDKNGGFIPYKMQEIVAKYGINLSKESYSLNWLGKSYARLLANEAPLTLLKEDTEHNQKAGNKSSENLLIKGDNLEVLKHLRYAYSEQVKVIYIDPPYNTGSDGFVYQDDRKFTFEQLSILAGIDEDEARRILEFTSTKSNSHSAWLTFIYPRLYIAKELLSDDGVIFISIDDNEQAQLKMLCDEVFGEDNFVAKFSWVKTATPPSLSNTLRKKVEYALCYKKQSMDTLFGCAINGGDAPIINKDNKISTLMIPSTCCYFKTLSGKIKAGKYEGIELLTDIEINNNYANCDFKVKGHFKWKQNFLNKEIKKGTNFVVKSDRFSMRYARIGERNVKPANIIDKNNGGVGTNEDAGKEMRLLNMNGLFSNPKPTSLIKYLVNMVCHTNDVIIDFFAGSGTTADAVMQLNAQDGGNRKCISVQIAESIDKNKSRAAYDFVKDKLGQENPSIFDITKERILRAAKKIQAEQKNKGDLFSENKKLDFGFKVFEILPMFDGYFDEMDELEQEDKQLKIFDGASLLDDELQTLLTTWMVNDGIKLTYKVEPITLDKYTSYYADKKLYLMDKGFTTDDLKALLEKLDSDKNFQPIKLVLFGYNFESKQQREISEALNNYRNKKQIELDGVVRY